MTRNKPTAHSPNALARERRRASWLRRHRVAASLTALLLVAAAVTAALLIRQDVAVTPSAKAPDVIFAQGDDYALINSAGYATAVIGASGTSATFAVSGIPGAALVQLGDVLQLENTHATQDYLVTLKVSADPNAAIDGFDVQVYSAADALIESFDGANAASGTQFSLPAATVYDITIEISIVDGTATPSTFSAFDLQFEIVPAPA